MVQSGGSFLYGNSPTTDNSADPLATDQAPLGMSSIYTYVCNVELYYRRWSALRP